MLYEQIFKKLNEEKIDYLVVGGVALVLHGAVRFTADLDLMIMPKAQNLQRIVSVLKSLGYKPKLPQLPKEQLEHFVYNTTPEMRLKWLEEAMEFVRKFVYPKHKDYWEKINSNSK